MVDYTNAAGYVVDSKGRRQFQDRDKVNGIDGTSLIADDRNQDRNSLVDLVEAAGMTPDGSDETQVTQAVQYFGKKAASGMVSGSPGVLASGDVAGAILYYSGAGNAPAFIYGDKTALLLTSSALNGYATQTWANGQFLQLANAAVQAVTGPVTFSGITMVPTPTDYSQKQAIGASDADARYARVAYENTFTTLQTFNAGADIGVNEVLTFHADNAYQLRVHPYISGTEQGLAIGLFDGANNPFGWLNIASTGRPYTNMGVLALTSELPLPVGMHVQIFSVTIPKGTSNGIYGSPFVASLPQAFSTFSFANGGDTGASVYTVAAKPNGNSQVSIWVASPVHQSGSLDSDVTVTIAAYGYY